MVCQLTVSVFSLENACPERRHAIYNRLSIMQAIQPSNHANVHAYSEHDMHLIDPRIIDCKCMYPSIYKYTYIYVRVHGD